MANVSYGGVLNCDFQDCSDMHSWGPGLRANFVIHYVIKGRGTFVSNGSVYRVAAGQSFIIYPFAEVFYHPDPDDPWEYAWVDFSGEKYQRILRKTAFGEESCVSGSLEPEKILPFFVFLRESCTEGKVNQSDGLLSTILGVYADNFPADAASAETEYFTAAKNIIQGCYFKTDFGLPELCERLGISRTTLHRVFKKEAGMPPGEYISSFRVEVSKALLVRGVSVKATALSCGFADPLYFSRAFSAAEGISPSAYRRRYMKA